MGSSGFFYGEKVTKEETKEEKEKESGSNESVTSEKESDKVDTHVPREFLMQPTKEDENISSSSLTKKQPINLKDENEIIVEETEPTEVATEIKPAIVKMVTCHSETSKEEESNTSSGKKDDLVQEATKEEPASVEM